MNSIERGIAESENKYNIKEEIKKEFIEIIEEDKIFIPIEHYEDIYTLSKHFCKRKLTTLLDNMMEKIIDTNLNFCNKILLDTEGKEKYKEKTNNEETEILSKIENIIKTRVNECMTNEKFKEVSISMIYRIIKSSITADREIADVNYLLGLIEEISEISLENAFFKSFFLRFIMIEDGEDNFSNTLGCLLKTAPNESVFSTIDDYALKNNVTSKTGNQSINGNFHH